MRKAFFLELEDVWIGEVWLASGQSNMEWMLDQCGVLGKEAIRSAQDQLLRVFTVEKKADMAPQKNVKGRWQSASPECAGEFSAVAYHFARRMRAELKVPVGVIVSAYGGTPIEAWMPRSAHVISPLLNEKLRQYEAVAYSDERWKSLDDQGAIVFPEDPGISDVAACWSESEEDDSDWPTMILPKTWQLDGHGHSGVFWFRKRVTIPSEWVGRDLRLEPGALDKHDITFVNGLEVGRTGKDFESQHWSVPRSYTVPASCVSGQDLLVAVRVYSFVYDGGMIGPAEKMRLSCPELGDRPLSLSGEWHYHIEHDFGYVPSENNPGHLSRISPYILYDNMIAPLLGYGLRGMLWYQGESNKAHPLEYKEHLLLMISTWRAAWQQGRELPFLIVQLPGHGMEADYAVESKWAQIRQGQLDIVREVSGTGLAVTIDCGDAEDIHPMNKEPVGYRLAQWALAETYGKTDLRGGPLPLRLESSANERLEIYFDDVGSGLATTEGLPVEGIFLVDAKGTTYKPEVFIESDKLVVSLSACPEAEAVAYAWADFPPKTNLINSEGFPASPFCFPII